MGAYDIAVDTGSYFFEPFDTSDTETYKITSEPDYTAAEVKMPKIVSGPRVVQRPYVLLVPQWWRWEVKFDAWVNWKWASPNHRIALQRPIAPSPPFVQLANAGAGNLGVSGDSRLYLYLVTYVTSNGECRPASEIPHVGFNVVTVLHDTNGQVDVIRQTLPNEPPFTAWRIYRSVGYTGDGSGTGGTYTDGTIPVKFVAEVAAGTDVYRDNTADVDLGADPPKYPILPLSNSVSKDWFFLPSTLNSDWYIDYTPGQGLPTLAAGFYWCSNAPGAIWSTDWTFCSADEATPPSSGCYATDNINYRTAQALRHFSVSGRKQALTRPVFPQDGAAYSTTGITPVFRKHATDFLGIPWTDEGTFAEADPDIVKDHYQTLVIDPDLRDANMTHALCKWVEISHQWAEFFNIGSFFGGQPWGGYYIQLGLVGSAHPDSAFLPHPAGQIVLDTQSADASFDMANIVDNQPNTSSDTIFPDMDQFDTGAASHWWSANGKLTITRANTPAGSLVAAIQIDVDHRYFIWRRVDSIGRDDVLFNAIPFDSQIGAFGAGRLDYSPLSGHDPIIPRKRVRSSGDGPPGSLTFDFEF